MSTSPPVGAVVRDLVGQFRPCSTVPPAVMVSCGKQSGITVGCNDTTQTVMATSSAMLSADISTMLRKLRS